jgi:Uma2 family endonuclease
MATVVDIPDIAMRSLGADWNYARWEKLPDDGNRYEVIDGVLYMTTAPSFFHQWVVQQFVRYIGIPAQDANTAFFAFAPVGVLMPGCDPVQPDFVIVLSHRRELFQDRRIYGVPDLIVEVLSPNNPENDEEIKLGAYARAGVPEYVIVDPAARSLRHYRRPANGRYGALATYAEDETVSFECLPTIRLTIGDLFAGAPDTTL